MGMQIAEERSPMMRGYRRPSLQKLDARSESAGYLQTSRERVDHDDWKVDESWTAIIGYMAELSFPGEG